MCSAIDYRETGQELKRQKDADLTWRRLYSRDGDHMIHNYRIVQKLLGCTMFAYRTIDTGTSKNS